MKKRNRNKATTSTAVIRHTLGRFTPLILVLCAITLLLFSRTEDAAIQKLRTAVTDITAPAIEFVSYPFVTAGEAIGNFTNITSLKSENIRLHAENEKLRQWYETALRLQAENKSLQSLLNLIEDPVRQYITTRVIADTGGRFVHSLLVPAGQKDGVEKGFAAITEEGLIGRVTQVGKNASRILLITDLNSHIPVIVENSRQRAILTGDNTKTATLRYLPPDSAVDIGARIVTSGHGGVLPPGLPVGIVTKNENGDIRVQPYADLDRLHFVQIINAGLNLEQLDDVE